MTDYPKYLYCYFPIDKGLDFLRTLKFRLSPISDFNDPFESLFHTEYPYFFLTYDENTDNTLIEKRIEVMNLKKWPYLKSLRNKSYGYVNLIKNIRIGCLSETPDNILMWGHYARKFTGIVVKFRVSYSDWGNDLKKVEYNDDRIYLYEFDASVIGFTNEERKLLTRKSKQWEYEKEWRCIKLSKECPKDETGHYKSIEKDSISEIIVGCRISPANLKSIKTLVKNKFQDKIPLKVIIPSMGNYTLEIWDLNKVDFALQWNKEEKKN